MDGTKVIGIIALFVLAIGALIGLAFGLELLGLEWTKFFAPKRENVRREVFEQTKSYNEAKEQELLKYRLEYMRCKSEVEREAIANTIRHAFADYDDSKLDPELQAFLKQIKYGNVPSNDF